METKEARIHLLRHSKTEWGAFGVLFDENSIPFVVTLENEETLLPVGMFKCHHTIYHHGKPQPYPTFEIEVPNRSRILFHKLNFDFQSKGCIGVGSEYEFINGIPAISESDKGFTEFYERFKKYQFLILTVEEHIIQPYKRA